MTSATGGHPHLSLVGRLRVEVLAAQLNQCQSASQDQRLPELYDHGVPAVQVSLGLMQAGCCFVCIMQRHSSCTGHACMVRDSHHDVGRQWQQSCCTVQPSPMQP